MLVKYLLRAQETPSFLNGLARGCFHVAELRTGTAILLSSSGLVDRSHIGVD